MQAFTDAIRLRALGLGARVIDEGPPGSKERLALTAPATRTRTQRPRKYLAIHAAELVVEPVLAIAMRIGVMGGD